jgi:hypothetical protein
MIVDWLKRLLLWVLSLFTGGAHRQRERRPAAEIPYGTKIFDDRSRALDATQRERILAIVEKAGSRKWAILRCPCGCGRELALNLMRSHSPVWRVTLNQAGGASLEPSVHSTTCGAHFWLRDGIVTWCE